MRAASLLRAAGLAACALPCACSLAPAYKVPAIDLPDNYQEPAPWVQATPADQIPRGAWWSIFHDDQLSQLEAELDAHNPDLAAALAHYDEARAYDLVIGAEQYPTVSGVVDASRDRQSDTRPLRGNGQPDDYGSYTLGLQIDYELDFWGKVRNEVVAVHAETAAAAADLASARLSLEARLADDFVALLGTDREIKLLLDTVDSDDKALKLTQTLHGGGVVSGLDVSRAQALLESARAQVSEARGQRALLEHAIAALTGAPAPAFRIAPQPRRLALPDIPSGLPASLLQRRPDIAAAERRTAEANAVVGVARAAYYPSIDLSAVAGFQSTSAGSWLMAPSAYWAIGPNIAQYIFDAGVRDAQLARTRAALDEAGDHYRAVVLDAFRQVQDQLSLLADYRSESGDQEAAVIAANRTLELSLEQYRDGAVDYLNFVDSQVAALAAQRTLLQLQTRQLRASIELVRALGGGWQADERAPMAATTSAGGG